MRNISSELQIFTIISLNLVNYINNALLIIFTTIHVIQAILYAIVSIIS